MVDNAIIVNRLVPTFNRIQNFYYPFAIIDRKKTVIVNVRIIIIINILTMFFVYYYYQELFAYYNLCYFHYYFGSVEKLFGIVEKIDSKLVRCLDSRWTDIYFF